MNREDVDTFEKLKAQLDSAHQEMSLLAKKSPNDAVNAFKLNFINSTLVRCNEFLREYKPFQDFNTFSPDELPSNSDVTFIFSQYIEAAEKFRSDNIMISHGSWIWRLDSDERIRTAAPKKLIQK